MRRPGLAVIVASTLAFASTAHAAPNGVCVVSCEGGPLSADERASVAAAVEPTLLNVEVCLAANDAGNAHPFVLAAVRDRTVTVTQIVAGGHEQLACMPKLSTTEAQLLLPGLLCDLRCDVAAAPVPAPAPVAPVDTTPPLPPRDRWYGWQSMVMDGTALTLALGAAIDGSTAGAGLGLLVYVAGPPFVHFAHRRVGPAFASFALRAFAPLLLGFAGAIAVSPFSGRGDWITSEGAGVGFAVGAFVGCAVAVVIDTALLSYEKIVARPRPAEPRRVIPALTLSPTPNGGFLGAAGLTGAF